MMEQLSLFPDIPPPEEKTSFPRMIPDADFWQKHITPKAFGSYIGQDEDTICRKCTAKQINAVNLNPQGDKARWAIPIKELEKFQQSECNIYGKQIEYLKK